MNKVSIYKVQLIKEASVEFDNLVIKSPDDAADVARKFYEFSYGGMMPDREVSVGIWLTSKNVVCGIEVVSIGSLNAAIVHPREVFVGAITHKAASIIFVHNHPSGDIMPSPEDINITKRLKEAGEIIGIDLLDHLIIGDEQYCSLNEKGYI